MHHSTAQHGHWHQSRQRGAALVLVLWLVAALSLLVLVSANGIRQQTGRMAVDLERLQMELLLDSAVQLGVQSYMNDRAIRGSYRSQRLQLGQRLVQIDITPTTGLVDINTASDELLQTLLEKVAGQPPDEATSLRTHIREWLNPQAVSAGRQNAPAARRLQTPADMRMVPSMSEALYETIAPFLGINGQSNLWLDATPPALIDALTGQPGLGMRVHSAPAQTRASHLMAVPAAGLFSPGRGGGGALTVRIQVSARAEGGRWWQREAWLDLSTRPDALTPWTTLWLEPVRRRSPPQHTEAP